MAVKSHHVPPRESAPDAPPHRRIRYRTGFIPAAPLARTAVVAAQAAALGLVVVSFFGTYVAFCGGWDAWLGRADGWAEWKNLFVPIALVGALLYQGLAFLIQWGALVLALHRGGVWWVVYLLTLGASAVPTYLGYIGAVEGPLTAWTGTAVTAHVAAGLGAIGADIVPELVLVDHE